MTVAAKPRLPVFSEKVMSSSESPYYDAEVVRRSVELGRHREFVGGLWEEIGMLQFRFLKGQGLGPQHKLADIGCGCLRGGLHFIRYLEPGNYFGADINQALLDAGFEIELPLAGVQQRMPRHNLLCAANFDLTPLRTEFDFILAQSLFTHVTLNRIRQCLARVARVTKPGSIFYATFFELPDGVPSDEPWRHHPGDVVTHGSENPYHYRFADLKHASRGLPWSVHYVGEWGHPKGQRMVAFVRQHEPDAAAAESASEVRNLAPEQALLLGAGDQHYRAYVGPPDRFDFMSATQFSLLFANGLRERHRVLDFGCGSLRLGRLLIPYLLEGRYFGVEPNRWLIDDALARELGEDIVRLKRPTFSHRSDFDCAALGTTFDFIVAQSIVTHCGPMIFRELMRSFSAVLEPDGLILFSYIQAPNWETALPSEGWHYPDCVAYAEPIVEEFLKAAGLIGISIPWYHPGAKWYLAARSSERLPNAQEVSLLTGMVLFDPQFAASRPSPPANPREFNGNSV